MSKTWLPVKGYEGTYSVSNQGDIRRDIRACNGRGWNAPGRFLSPRPVRGYLYVTLTINGKRHDLKIHRIVAMTFIGMPQEPFNQVNHLNGNKKDNRPSNLEWTNAKGNSVHASRMGLKPSGDKHWTRKNPEKLFRGDNHWTRKHPEWLARGSEWHKKRSH